MSPARDGCDHCPCPRWSSLGLLCSSFGLQLQAASEHALHKYAANAGLASQQKPRHALMTVVESRCWLSWRPSGRGGSDSRPEGALALPAADGPLAQYACSGGWLALQVLRCCTQHLLSAIIRPQSSMAQMHNRAHVIAANCTSMPNVSHPVFHVMSNRSEMRRRSPPACLPVCLPVLCMPATLTAACI